jgi:hypothetical protein
MLCCYWQQSTAGYGASWTTTSSITAFDNYAKNFRNPPSENETLFQQPLVLSIVPVIAM